MKIKTKPLPINKIVAIFTAVSLAFLQAAPVSFAAELIDSSQPVVTVAPTVPAVSATQAITVTPTGSNVTVQIPATPIQPGENPALSPATPENLQGNASSEVAPAEPVRAAASVVSGEVTVLGQRGTWIPTGTGEWRFVLETSYSNGHEETSEYDDKGNVTSHSEEDRKYTEDPEDPTREKITGNGIRDGRPYTIEGSRIKGSKGQRIKRTFKNDDGKVIREEEGWYDDGSGELGERKITETDPDTGIVTKITEEENEITPDPPPDDGLPLIAPPGSGFDVLGDGNTRFKSTLKKRVTKFFDPTTGKPVSTRTEEFDPETGKPMGEMDEIPKELPLPPDTRLLILTAFAPMTDYYNGQGYFYQGAPSAEEVLSALNALVSSCSGSADAACAGIMSDLQSAVDSLGSEVAAALGGWMKAPKTAIVSRTSYNYDLPTGKPYWNEVVTYSPATSKMTGSVYTTFDLVTDKKTGCTTSVRNPATGILISSVADYFDRITGLRISNVVSRYTNGNLNTRGWTYFDAAAKIIRTIAYTYQMNGAMLVLTALKNSQYSNGILSSSMTTTYDLATGKQSWNEVVTFSLTTRKMTGSVYTTFDLMTGKRTGLTTSVRNAATGILLSAIADYFDRVTGRRISSVDSRYTNGNLNTRNWTYFDAVGGILQNIAYTYQMNGASLVLTALKSSQYANGVLRTSANTTYELATGKQSWNEVVTFSLITRKMTGSVYTTFDLVTGKRTGLTTSVRDAATGILISSIADYFDRVTGLRISNVVSRYTNGNLNTRGWTYYDAVGGIIRNLVYTYQMIGMVLSLNAVEEFRYTSGFLTAHYRTVNGTTYEYQPFTISAATFGPANVAIDVDRYGNGSATLDGRTYTGIRFDPVTNSMVLSIPPDSYGASRVVTFYFKDRNLDRVNDKTTYSPSYVIDRTYVFTPLSPSQSFQTVKTEEYTGYTNGIRTFRYDTVNDSTGERLEFKVTTYGPDGTIITKIYDTLYEDGVKIQDIVTEYYPGGNVERSTEDILYTYGVATSRSYTVRDTAGAITGSTVDSYEYDFGNELYDVDDYLYDLGDVTYDAGNGSSVLVTTQPQNGKGLTASEALKEIKRQKQALVDHITVYEQQLIYSSSGFRRRLTAQETADIRKKIDEMRQKIKELEALQAKIISDITQLKKKKKTVSTSYDGWGTKIQYIVSEYDLDGFTVMTVDDSRYSSNDLIAHYYTAGGTTYEYQPFTVAASTDPWGTANISIDVALSGQSSLELEGQRYYGNFNPADQAIHISIPGTATVFPRFLSFYFSNGSLVQMADRALSPDAIVTEDLYTFSLSSVGGGTVQTVAALDSSAYLYPGQDNAEVVAMMNGGGTLPRLRINDYEDLRIRPDSDVGGSRIDGSGVRNGKPYKITGHTDNETDPEIWVRLTFRDRQGRIYREILEIRKRTETPGGDDPFTDEVEDDPVEVDYDEVIYRLTREIDPKTGAETNAVSEDWRDIPRDEPEGNWDPAPPEVPPFPGLIYSIVADTTAVGFSSSMASTQTFPDFTPGYQKQIAWDKTRGRWAIPDGWLNDPTNPSWQFTQYIVPWEPEPGKEKQDPELVVKALDWTIDYLRKAAKGKTYKERKYIEKYCQRLEQLRNEAQAEVDRLQQTP